MRTNKFDEIVVVDFEYSTAPGHPPNPVCMAAWELNTNRKWRVWEDELRALKTAPFPTGRNSLVIAYYAIAEMSCFLVLNWQLPLNVLDLCIEFKNLTNGIKVEHGKGLLSALYYFGLNGIDAAEKDTMRNLAMRGGPWTEAEKIELLDYCESDVISTGRLYLAWKSN